MHKGAFSKVLAARQFPLLGLGYVPLPFDRRSFFGMYRVTEGMPYIVIRLFTAESIYVQTPEKLVFIS